MYTNVRKAIWYVLAVFKEPENGAIAPKNVGELMNYTIVCILWRLAGFDKTSSY
jgi:hypothetical protein